MSCEINNKAGFSSTDLEPDISDAALSTYCVKKMASPVSIRVISYRRLKHDPDGISAKAVIDGLVQAGILTDDSSEQVTQVTFESRKSKDERTEIIIEEIEGEI